MVKCFEDIWTGYNKKFIDDKYEYLTNHEWLSEYEKITIVDVIWHNTLAKNPYLKNLNKLVRNVEFVSSKNNLFTYLQTTTFLIIFDYNYENWSGIANSLEQNTKKHTKFQTILSDEYVTNNICEFL